MLHFFFGFNGRIRRSTYFFGAIGAILLWCVLGVSTVVAVAIASGAHVDPGTHSLLINDDADIHASPLWGIAFAAIGLLALWSSLALTVKRWHDIGQSGWFALLSLPPFANAAMFLLLCLLPGTVGANRYGSDPRGRNAIVAPSEPMAA